jgi:hypothetical protein
MKEFVAKVTFGFLMAQLFPGAAIVFMLCLAFWSPWIDQALDLRNFVGIVGEKLFASASAVVILIFLSVAVGMLVHGIHWLALGVLEGPDDVKRPIRDLKRHRMPIFLQILFGPFLIMVELLQSLFAGKLEHVLVDENVCEIDPEGLPVFLFLQEFYLYFGQFYAHMAYAALISLACFVRICQTRGWTTANISTCAVLFVSCGIFYLLGRVTLSSLFRNERKLCK